jgi:hypothetical protein
MLSYYCLGLLAVLMIADYSLTVHGLRLGFQEYNQTALAALRWGGNVGMALYALACFSLNALVVYLWPHQWAAPLLGCVGGVETVINNVRVLRAKTRSPCQAGA